MAIFDPERCACIDKTDAATVWRGNIPINKKGRFAYHELAVALELDPDTVLVDISVIDNVKGGEREQWLVELNAYEVPVVKFPGGPNIPPQFNQPNWDPGQLLGDGVKVGSGKAPGHLVWWQIEGGANPATLGPDVQSYNFIGLIEYLGVLRKQDKFALYIHCMNGTDRTGAVVAAYGMRYLGMDLKEAMEFAAQVPQAGTMNEDYKKLVAAYWGRMQTKITRVAK